MKAFRNVAGTVVEVLIDIDIDGNPILPPDTTIDPKPEPLEGHYVTVVGKEWVQIPIPREFKAFESKKTDALAKLAAYRDWKLQQPTEHLGVLFDADEQARNRISQVISIHTATGQLPPEWVTLNNNAFPISTIDDLKALATTIFTAFSERFYHTNTLRRAILDAEDEAALSAAVEAIPAIEMFK